MRAHAKARRTSAGRLRGPSRSLIAAMALSLTACVEVVLVDASDGSGGRGGDGAAGSGAGPTGGAGGEGAGGGAGGDCGCEALDIVLAIDNTDSLDDHVVSLVQVFLQLGNQIDAVAARACSFHFGVVTSKPQGLNPAPCQQLGAFSRVNAGGDACPLANGRFATDRDNLKDTIPCLAQTGTGADGGERLMTALLAALSDPTLNGPGGCNEGFFRPEASLLVLYLSDIDDTLSSGGPSDWFGALTQLNGGDASRLGALAVLPPATGSPCSGELAPRLHTFLGLHEPGQHVAANLCDLSAAEIQAAVDTLADGVCPLPR